MKQIIMIVVALLVAFFAYIYLQPKLSSNNSINSTSTDNTGNIVFSDEELANIPPTYNEANESVAFTNSEVVVSNTPTQAFVCDARKHCSQMRSCAEATYFSNNCPNTKMDGNNDGVPCEQQWCN